MAHSTARLQTLIEHRVGEHYFLYDPDLGARTFMPDSPEWFAWLASLSSFHFQGQHGHLTARHEKKQRGERYWYAYRKAYGHQHKRYLGTTDKLFLAHLEHAARALSEAALGGFPEDEVLNAHAQKHKRVTHEVKVGPLMIQWDQGVLFVRTPIESHLLNRAEAALLLSYLYDRRRSLLPQRE